MIHRTFRSLDEAPKLVGFTARQWAALIAAAIVILGLLYEVHLPTRAAITLCVFAIGLPASLTYVSESGGLNLGVLLGDLLRWRFSPHTLVAASSECRAARGLLVIAAGHEFDEECPARGLEVGVEDMAYWERWD